MNLGYAVSLILSLPLAVVFSMLTGLYITRRWHFKVNAMTMITCSFISYFIWAGLLATVIYYIGKMLGA